MQNDIIDTNLSKFICKCCDFNCNSRGDWNKHIVRPKHINNEKTYNTPIEVNETKEATNTLLQCECGNKYTYTSGLWRHKKRCKCNQNNEDITDVEENIKITPAMFYDLLHLLTFQTPILDEVIITWLFTYFPKGVKVQLPFFIPTKYRSFDILL